MLMLPVIHNLFWGMAYVIMTHINIAVYMYNIPDDLELTWSKNQNKTDDGQTWL